MKRRGTLTLIIKYLKISKREFLCEALILVVGTGLLVYMLQFHPLTLIGWLCLIPIAFIMLRHRIEIKGANILGLEMSLSSDEIASKLDLDTVAEREGIDPCIFRHALQGYGDRVPAYALPNGDVYIRIHNSVDQTRRSESG